VAEAVANAVDCVLTGSAVMDGRKNFAGEMPGERSVRWVLRRLRALDRVAVVESMAAAAGLSLERNEIEDRESPGATRSFGDWEARGRIETVRHCSAVGQR